MEEEIQTAQQPVVSSPEAQAQESTSSAGHGTLSQTDSALHDSSEQNSDSSFINTKDDSSSQRGGDSSDNDNRDGEYTGPRRCSRKWIAEHFKKEWKMYYRTFELNEKLYFHYKGFERIENMNLFPDLKCLYWEGNCVQKISGLESNTELLSLYLQENMIRKIEGLSTLSKLHTLQLQDNQICTIEGLQFCVNLDSLYLKNNRIGQNGLSDLMGLLECPSLVCLDIQNNRVADAEVMEEVIMKMPNLKVLYMQKNEISKGKLIPSYRKTVIAKLPNLKYLDDRPVFVEDRRHAEAWYRGGIEEERAERAKIKQEEADRHFKNHQAFKEMMRKAREDRR